MEREQYYFELGRISEECVIFDDFVVNPIEIVLFARNRSRLLKELKKRNLLFFFENQKERHVRVMTYRELGIRRLEEVWHKNGQRGLGNCLFLSEEDKEAFISLYIWTYTTRDSWVRSTALHTLKCKYSFNEEQLVHRLVVYLKANKVKLYLRRIVNLPDEIRASIGSMRYILFTLKRLLRRVVRRGLLEILVLRGFFHRLFSRKRYMKSLMKSPQIRGQLVPMWGLKGSTECRFVKEIIGKEVFFVKGNEMPLYCGLKNEVSAQKVLRETQGEEDWYLPMVDYDAERWIKYDYVQMCGLDDYLKGGKKLDKEALQVLGDNLILMVGKLQKIKLRHSDLHPGNLLLDIDEKGNVLRFVLTDFGCSSLEGSFPWDRENRWRKYFAKDLCGKYRYSESIVDDAAAAYLVYIDAGGSRGDEISEKLYRMIGNSFLDTVFEE